MSKVEFHLHKSQVDRVLAWLGNRGVLQLAQPPARTRADSPARVGFRSLQECRVYLGVRDLPSLPPDTPPPDPDVEEETRKFLEDVSIHRERRDALARRIRECEEALAEIRAFVGLGRPLGDLPHTSFLTWRVGRWTNESRQEATRRLGERVLVLPLETPGLFVALTSRREGAALDEELMPLGFHPIELPEGMTGIPSEIARGLEVERQTLAAHHEQVERDRERWALACGERLRGLLASWAVAVQIEGIREACSVSEHVCSLQGWMPSSDVGPVLDELDRLTDGRIGVRVYDPYELESVRAGRETVPVRLRHGPVVRGFERLVLSYGAPLYGTVDPTPLVAVSFVLLFALMFGDMGQGFVLLLIGWALSSGRFEALTRWKDFAPIFASIGLAAMGTGFLYGSVFSSDRLLVPVARWVTGLFGPPEDHIVTLLPDHGFGRVAVFFGFTIAVGVVLNSVGLVVNIINRFRLGQTKAVWFSRTGVAGAVFLWYAVFFAVRLLLGGRAEPVDGIGFLVPLVAMTVGPLVIGRTETAVGWGTLLLEAVVELLETASYWLSNTLSFLRVGAFALAHAVLSLCVFTLGDLVATSSALGPWLSLLVYLVGNLLILVLEGMIVAIQVVRLQYYEFFSKFFTDVGELFRPFRFEYKEAFS